jgi:RNA polymerase sigma-70 factor (ECF subfamily)
MKNDISSHWKNFLEGNNSALGSLYEELFEPLVFRAISYTGDPEIARDIVAQLFSELILSPKSVRIERWEKVKDPHAFLLVIVRNKCLDHLRVTTNRQRIHKVYALEQDVVVTEDQEKQLYLKLERCLASLSDEEQKLLDLHLNGYRNAHIANELNLKEKTVRNRLSLTRKVLAIRWQQLFILLGWLWS